MTSSRNVMDQQVDDLRMRMRLLQQDRRANVELLEANKASNVEEIKSLREDNKKLRLRLTQLQKCLSSDENGTNELANLQREALKLRTEYDALKMTSTKNRDQMSKLKDEAKTCELEAVRPTQEDGPIARKIRMLENKLDKAMIKYNEAQSIRSTYEHIVKRLKEERLSFNNQLSALERTLRAKKRDYDELLLLSGDANHAREVAQHELQQARIGYDEKRSRRSGELRERQQVVKIRRQMLEKQERRDEMKREASKQQMEANRSQTEEELQQYALINDKDFMEEQERKLQIYEDAFRKIKEVTGVSDVNDVIENVKGQKGVAENLITLKKQNQERIEKLMLERETLMNTVENLKFGGDSVNITRKMVDMKELEYDERNCNFERSKNKYDRISTILISAKSGIKHIHDRVEKVASELIDNKIEYDDSNPATSLWTIGNVLIELLARLREREMNDLHDNNDCDEVFGVSSSQIQMNANEYDLEEKMSSLDFVQNISHARPFNQRISLPSAKDDIYEDRNECEVFGDLDEEELSRDIVKKASTQILRAATRANSKVSKSKKS